MRRGPNPFEKRQKELARKEKQRKKAERRDLREQQKSQRAEGDREEDPDIAGIVPGPQPPPADE
jgi:hypothetical protein